MEMEDRIKFEGYFDGNDEYKNNISKTIKNLFIEIIQKGMYQYYKYKPEFLPISAEMEKIQYIIGFQPKVQAWANTSNNVIGINLFNIAILTNLTLFQDIIKFITEHNSCSIDDLMDFFSGIQKSQNTIHEIDKIFNLFDQYTIKNNNGKAQIIWNMNLFNSNDFYEYPYIVLKLMFHHEMAHWHLSKFNDETRLQYIGKARSELVDYLKLLCESSGNFEIFKSFFYLENLNSQLMWAEEIAADIMSFMSMLNTCKTPAEGRDIYISIGLYYALLRIVELCNDRNGVVKITTTHPPAQIREAVVERLFAQDRGIDLNHFRTHFGAAWYMVRTSFDIIIENYVAEVENGQIRRN